MIRVNLLAEGRRPVAYRARTAEAKARDLGQILLFAAIGLGAVLSLGHWWLLHSTIQRKQQEIVAVQKEVDELAPIIKEVEEFEAKKAELEHKIQVINGLKANQKGPVRIMDEISRALPEMLWLTRMDAIGSTITLQGEAFNTNAVANFIENLDRVPEFQEPVLRDTTSRVRAKSQLFTFSISFGYSYAPPVEGNASEAAAGEGA